MRIAVDTNVLVRYLIDDEPDQALLATQLLEGRDEIVISTIVLCELVWVLDRFYRLPAAEIMAGLNMLTSLPQMRLDEDALKAGLDMMENGGGFADGCILDEARRAGCETLATFDKKLSKLGTDTVTLLA